MPPAATANGPVRTYRLRRRRYQAVVAEAAHVNPYPPRPDRGGVGRGGRCRRKHILSKRRRDPNARRRRGPGRRGRARVLAPATWTRVLVLATWIRYVASLDRRFDRRELSGEECHVDEIGRRREA